MAKIYLDAGHGGHDPGAVGNGLREKDVVLKIVKYARDYLLKNYKGVSVRLSRTTDKYLSLSQRANDANRWGADVFVSVHINAGGGKGYEDFIWNGNVSSNTRSLQNAVHNEVSKHFNTNRGKKRANFAVLRETRMPAVLTENGFIDNKQDANFLKKNSNLKKLGEAHAKGIAVFLGLAKGSSGRSSLSGGSSSNNIKWVGTDDKGKYLEVIAPRVNFYDTQRWTNPTGYATKGQKWIIDNLYRVNGSLQYRVQNSKGDLYYTTARKDLVRVVDGSSSSSSGDSTSFKVGDKVTVKNSAKTYATGESIPSWIKGSTYTVQQVKNDRVLLKEIYSWVRKSDLVGGSSSSRSSSSSPSFRVGSKVTLKNSAKSYATGETIPSRYKGKTYTIQQVKSDRVLLKELYSWVYKKDVQ